MTYHFGFHSIIMGGKSEGGEGGDIEGGLTYGEDIDDAFSISQSHNTKKEGCRP